MNAIVTVIGRTSGGDQIESNPNSLLIEVVPDNYIRPGAEDDEEDDN